MPRVRSSGAAPRGNLDISASTQDPIGLRVGQSQLHGEESRPVWRRDPHQPRRNRQWRRRSRHGREFQRRRKDAMVAGDECANERHTDSAASACHEYLHPVPRAALRLQTSVHTLKTTQTTRMRQRVTVRPNADTTSAAGSCALRPIAKTSVWDTFHGGFRMRLDGTRPKTSRRAVRRR
jgi:hypothetical protein